MMDLVGASEVAEILGVARQRVYQLIAAYPKFPKPAAQLKRGKLWRRKDIERWVQAQPRKPGRPSH